MLADFYRNQATSAILRLLGSLIFCQNKHKQSAIVLELSKNILDLILNFVYLNFAC